MKKQPRRRGGIPGPPGPAGPRGERGQSGTRGITGQQGERGLQGAIGERGNVGAAAPSNRKQMVAEFTEHLDVIYKELDIQMRRMAQIQQQVDEMRAKLRSVGLPSLAESGKPKGMIRQ